MGTMLVDLFNDSEAVNFSSRVDFSMILIPAGGTIRQQFGSWVGCCRPAYELGGEKHPILLVIKAKQVADKMAFAWVGVRTCSLSMDFFDNAPRSQ
ncbi:hypothetical protein DFH08DRAFT_190210 [Mycena albidolilacea]|uniref:Uncharacterized protein n=1 Tax=Mycena albidolilacea TaxID=1033008 RepID=A0AAD7ASU5_9AGAR|nr:hypothetical protein DFH08DRAFT_190210 [Mycena albidolilacea]